MRRIAVLAAVVAAFLTLGAGVAIAIPGAQGSVIHCNDIPCIAEGDDDLVFERIGNGVRDNIVLKGGDDQVRAGRYGNDRDLIRGGSGFDKIFVDDGDRRDKVFAGSGRSLCYVDARSEVRGGCARVIVR